MFPVDTLTYDASPRRILIVLDTSHAMAAESWTVLSSLVLELLSRGRKQDSFALVTTEGPRIDLPFNTDRERLQQAVETLVKENRHGKASRRSVLEAVTQGGDWFGKPQLGDAIFLFLSSYVEGQEMLNYQGLLNWLTDHRIRLFTFTAGAFIAGRMDVIGFHVLVSTDNIGGVSLTSGGYDFAEDTEPAQSKYVVTDKRLSELKQMVLTMYGSMVEFYYLHVTAPTPRGPTTVDVILSDTLRKKIPDAVVLCPRRVQCTN